MPVSLPRSRELRRPECFYPRSLANEGATATSLIICPDSNCELPSANRASLTTIRDRPGLTCATKSDIFKGSRTREPTRAFLITRGSRSDDQRPFHVHAGLDAMMFAPCEAVFAKEVETQAVFAGVDNGQ